MQLAQIGFSPAPALDCAHGHTLSIFSLHWYIRCSTGSYLRGGASMKTQNEYRPGLLARLKIAAGSQRANPNRPRRLSCLAVSSGKAKAFKAVSSKHDC